MALTDSLLQIYITSGKNFFKYLAGRDFFGFMNMPSEIIS